MRTGENDKLDAKHNAGVGPGIRQLGQRGESRGNFSLFLSLSFRFTPLSPFSRAFHSAKSFPPFFFTFVRCQNRTLLPFVHLIDNKR